jgi:diacylglycerol kinase (ATP)
MRRIKIIFNPQANRGLNARNAEHYQRLAGELGGADWVMTQAPGHASELAQQSAGEGCERIVVLGGDGTVHEVINGLMQVSDGVRPQLGIVPVGSGNDFVRGARTERNPEQAFRLAFNDDHARRMDVGYLRVAGKPASYWVNVLGIGFDAAVTQQSLRIKRIRGSAMYFVAALRTIIENYNALMLDMEIDGVKRAQAVQMLTIGNGTREGGGFITTPGSRIDDGVLDYAMFQPMSRLMMVRLIPEVMRGTHGRFKQVRMGTLRSMRLRSDRPLLIHSDGEMMVVHGDDVREVEIGIKPAAISLVN